ncbi:MULTISPECIES: aldo/keto reductase [unclassified Pseudomonas]|uniref:aldo/keto reductase n=1 Tax=unclassified Pseudomonas TaxID=196821 RepID=UPI0025FFA0DF|nr:MULTISPECIES: aldo/keto reductase [unclassified Pseudomonas]
MLKRPLGSTGLNIAPLVFGGNVFGWTIDEKTSFAVLDAFVDQGFNAIDTADVYSAWVPGNSGGESEAIIGRWFKQRPGMRDKVAIFTKVGSQMGSPQNKGLSRRWILQAVEDSLRRLGTDHVDLYFSHWPDPQTPHEETLGTYAALRKAGKINALGASNYDATLLCAALKAAHDNDLPAYQVIQPEYNLYDRSGFEGQLQKLCITENIGVVTYFSLASGFLSGKYRSRADLGSSKRGDRLEKYLDEQGLKLLTALDAVAADHGAKQAEVALAWLINSPGVTAPIASATSVEQVASFAKATRLTLTDEQFRTLNEAL